MSKRRQYAEEDLNAAVSAVKQARLTCSQAARDYNIPRKTIADSLSGRYTKHNPGPQAMLGAEEESSLVEYIKYMQQQGFPMTRHIVRQYVKTICQKQGKSKSLFNLEKGPSDKWFRKFFTKHQELTERDSERQDRARARMSNETTVDHYFKLLEETIQKLGLENKPAQIYNCDETGFSGKEKPREKVIGLKGQHFYQQALFSSNHTTLHMCISADGRVIPSFVIFEKCLPHTAYKEGVPGNWMFAYSESGYMDSQLFYLWFKDLFLPNCGKARPVVLVMDNHDSHVNLDIVKLARDNKVELIGLPPHTTHFLQPLDVGINGPLKAKVNTLALKLGFVNTNQIISKAKFPTLLSYAIDQFCSPAKIKSAFKKSGLFPINRQAIDSSQILPSKFKKPQTEDQAKSSSSNESSSSENAAVPSTSSSGTSTSTLQPSDPSQTCDKCGSFLGGNPLVREGLVAPALADIFLPVPSKPVTTRRKCITEARVISSEDFYNSLVERSKEKEKREEEIAKRKKEREDKKRMKEEAISQKKEKSGKGKEKAQKKKPKTGKSSSSAPEADATSIYACEVCHQVDPPDDLSNGDDVQWVCCDNCEAWSHQDCVGIQGQGVEDAYFICTRCSRQAAET